MAQSYSSPDEGVCLDVPHIFQSEEWDCGLACLKMILRRPELPADERHFSDVCGSLGIRKSVWTIDLAYLLAQYNIRQLLCTITLGVDPTYKDVGFYNQFVEEEFSYEQQRVNKLFANSSSEGVNTEKRCISHADIVSHLSCRNPAIILIDDTILHCEWCCMANDKQTCGMGCLSLFKTHHVDMGYVGHFIVLCGYDVKRKQFLYRNPGISCDLCSCSFANLDQARRSYGTDEDILFICS